MILRSRPLAALTAAALIVAGCGGSSHRSTTARTAALVLMASAPNSLDPASGDTAEALEADWLAYTPLLTYKHADGPPGTQVVPGLAQTLPSIAAGGTIYTFTLIKGLRYSDGQPVRASDFIRAAERAIKLWPDAPRLITGHIVGASAFAAGRAKTIAGITANDSTGEITIHLTAPFGTFENVLALPVLAPVPANTPFADQAAAPPPGIGPYKIASVVPGRSFSLVRVRGWQRFGVANVPAGQLDIDVRITGDAAANARAVLTGTADVLDWRDQLPPSVGAQIRQRAPDRYLSRTAATTDLIFFNVMRKPFSSQLAREAVGVGLDQTRIAKLDSGGMLTGCFVLPPTVYGHPQGPCPYPGHDLAQAKTLVNRSGMTGAKVVVWSQPTSPVRQWMSYYASLLDEVGFKARLAYGDAVRDAQTGYSTLAPGLPNPVYFYEQLVAPGNRRRLDDSYITTTLQALAAVPGTTVGGVSGFWRQLERYVANKAYVAVLGYPTAPELVSSRIDFSRVVFSPLAGVDWSSLALK